LTLSHVGWANDDTEISLLSFFQLKTRSTVGEAVITEKHKIALVEPNWETILIVESKPLMPLFSRDFGIISESQLKIPVFWS